MKKRLWLDMLSDGGGHDLYWLRSTYDSTRIDPWDLYIDVHQMYNYILYLVVNELPEGSTLRITHYDLDETNKVIEDLKEWFSDHDKYNYTEINRADCKHIKISKL